MVGLLKAANIQALGNGEQAEQSILNELGLNWHGINKMSELDYARYFLETATKQADNLRTQESLEILRASASAGKPVFI